MEREGGGLSREKREESGDTTTHNAPAAADVLDSQHL